MAAAYLSKTSEVNWELSIIIAYRCQSCRNNVVFQDWVAIVNQPRDPTSAATEQEQGTTLEEQ
jgi:hypothetical protein